MAKNKDLARLSLSAASLDFIADKIEFAEVINLESSREVLEDILRLILAIPRKINILGITAYKTSDLIESINGALGVILKKNDKIEPTTIRRIEPIIVNIIRFLSKYNIASIKGSVRSIIV